MDVAGVLRIVPDVACPPIDCADVAEWVARYDMPNALRAGAGRRESAAPARASCGDHECGV
ncbi:hypothetical protein ACGFYY_35290 [Streptomyces sp. NPDC048331]|uniref:hypothetical protein n=1 Tax=Streptomyces sp. NPDC048331 TaxID=3365534 RepID=UPI003722082F